MDISINGKMENENDENGVSHLFSEVWVNRMIDRFNLGSTLRGAGRSITINRS